MTAITKRSPQRLLTVSIASILGAGTLLVGSLALPADARELTSGSANALQLSLTDDNIALAPRTGVFDDEEGGASYDGPTTPVPEPIPGIAQIGALSQTVTVGNATGGWGTDASASVANLRLSLVDIDGATALAVPSAEDLTDDFLASLNLGNLTDAELAEILGLDIPGLDALITELYGPEGTVDQLITAIQDTVNGAVDELEPVITQLIEDLDINVFVRTGAVTSEAHAHTLTADGAPSVYGESAVADGQIVAVVGGEEFVITNLPSGSNPNEVFTQNLDAVVELINTEVLGDVLRNSLNAALDPAFDAIYDPLQNALRDSVISRVDASLEGVFTNLNDSVVNGTVNSREELDGGLRVTALQLSFVPDAPSSTFNSVANLALAETEAVAVPREVDPVDNGDDDGTDDGDSGGPDDGGTDDPGTDDGNDDTPNDGADDANDEGTDKANTGDGAGSGNGGVGNSDLTNCANYSSQQEAQAALLSDTSDPNGLDGNNDGNACEDYDYGQLPSSVKSGI